MNSSRRYCVVLQSLLLAAICGPHAWGQGKPGQSPAPVVSHSQIEEALAQPADKPRTRGITIRGTSETRDSPGEESAAAPAVNLTVPFEYNSAELTPEAAAQLLQLEVALKSDALVRNGFMVSGHTDARGDAVYNRELSRRRAEAVKRFLVASGIKANRLQTQGRGEDQLLLPDQPEDARNRRVEIRNLGDIQ